MFFTIPFCEVMSGDGTWLGIIALVQHSAGASNAPRYKEWQRIQFDTIADSIVWEKVFQPWVQANCNALTEYVPWQNLTLYHAQNQKNTLLIPTSVGHKHRVLFDFVFISAPLIRKMQMAHLEQYAYNCNLLSALYSIADNGGIVLQGVYAINKLIIEDKAVPLIDVESNASVKIQGMVGKAMVILSPQLPDNAITVNGRVYYPYNCCHHVTYSNYNNKYTETMFELSNSKGNTAPINERFYAVAYYDDARTCFDIKYMSFAEIANRVQSKGYLLANAAVFNNDLYATDFELATDGKYGYCKRVLQDAAYLYSTEHYNKSSNRFEPIAPLTEASAELSELLKGDTGCYRILSSKNADTYPVVESARYPAVCVPSTYKAFYMHWSALQPNKNGAYPRFTFFRYTNITGVYLDTGNLPADEALGFRLSNLPWATLHYITNNTSKFKQWLQEGGTNRGFYLYLPLNYVNPFKPSINDAKVNYCFDSINITAKGIGSYAQKENTLNIQNVTAQTLQLCLTEANDLNVASLSNELYTGVIATLGKKCTLRNGWLVIDIQGAVTLTSSDFLRGMNCKGIYIKSGTRVEITSEALKGMDTAPLEQLVITAPVVELKSSSIVRLPHLTTLQLQANKIVFEEGALAHVVSLNQFSCLARELEGLSKAFTGKLHPELATRLQLMLNSTNTD